MIYGLFAEVSSPDILPMNDPWFFIKCIAKLKSGEFLNETSMGSSKEQ